MKTLTVDDYQRVRLPDVKPRQVFAHEKGPDGRIILTPVVPAKEPGPNKVRFVKENGRTVGIVEGANFDQAVIKELLSEFP